MRVMRKPYKKRPFIANREKSCGIDRLQGIHRCVLSGSKTPDRVYLETM